MSQLNSEEHLFYRSLYSVLNDPHISALLERYGRIEYEKALNRVRSKQDTYDYGYFNGQADAFKSLLDLKSRITEIMKR